MDAGAEDEVPPWFRAFEFRFSRGTGVERVSPVGIRFRAFRVFGVWGLDM